MVDKPAGATPDKSGEAVIPVFQEQLELGTRTVETGKGVRIHKRTVEHPQQVEQMLLHGDVDVRRVAVDRVVAASEAPVARYEGEVFIVPVVEEFLVVEKRLRIREELHITRTRRAERHVETVMLKSEEITIEHVEASPDAPTQS